MARARRESGLTQRELADQLGTTPWLVDRIERGAEEASRYLADVSRATGRSVDWFVQPVPGAANGAAQVPARPIIGTSRQTGRLLALGAICLLVTIRFFTEVIPVVPRALNFVDIPIFLVLAFASLNGPTTNNAGRAYLRVGAPAIAFVVLAILSGIINADRVAPAPALVFIYGFLGPIAVYASVYRIWPPGNARSLSRCLVVLVLVQLVVVAFIDIPRFIASENNPDQIAGTFGTNAYQLVFFLLIGSALLVGIFSNEPGRPVARAVPLLIGAILVVIMLAQYRAILATTVVTLVAIGALLRKRPRGIVAVTAAVIALALAFSYVATAFPRLKLEATATTLSESPWTYATRRYEGARPLIAMYGDIPFAVVVGTGPGTFSSRAWQTFANAGSSSLSNVQGGYARALTGGSYATDVSDKYVRPQLQKGLVVEGSHAVTSPHSSYTSLLAEVGVLGFVFMMVLYFLALTRSWRMARSALRAPVRNDPLPALALATFVAFLTLIQTAFLENWFEVTRITFIAWILLAIVARELDGREEAA